MAADMNSAEAAAIGNCYASIKIHSFHKFMLDWPQYLNQRGPIYSRSKAEACKPVEEAMNKAVKLEMKSISTPSA